MKKEAKFNKIFWVGLVPLSVIVFLFVMLIIGIIYGLRKDDVVRMGSGNEKSADHVCSKTDPEKIYIHDTVYLKTPQSCRREHVQVDTKPIVSESLKDANDTNNADRSTN